MRPQSKARHAGSEFVSIRVHPIARARGREAQFQIRGKEDVMSASVKQMLEAANAAVPRITPAQAREMIAKGNTLVVDVRDPPEVQQSGKVAGAVAVSRGMLEFRADPDSPYHDKNFAKNKSVIVYCASGGRSALAGKVLKDMGYEQVYNLGGFKDWAEAGGAVDKRSGEARARMMSGLASLVRTTCFLYLSSPRIARRKTRVNALMSLAFMSLRSIRRSLAVFRFPVAHG